MCVCAGADFGILKYGDFVIFSEADWTNAKQRNCQVSRVEAALRSWGRGGGGGD